ncbi:heterokaryon incompatibility protein-domain-containing protein [Paraphoma chrysanthemicola]|nr:heterokaryon incompatibility protein-domain-containing protein [Paraphoma chrysanthemicola]
MARPSRPQNQPGYLRYGDETYLLQRLSKGTTPSGGGGETQRSRPRRFDDPSFKNMKTYEYDKLPEKSIRLMLLNGGPLGDSIQCELVEAAYNNPFHIPTKAEHGHLTDAGKKLARLKERLAKKEKSFQIQKQELETVEEIEIEYEALSWCWGQDSSDYAITIKKGSENYKMGIREDLALALMYLRHKEKTRTLWIDAICIDQANSVERNQQVQMMSRIYTRADNVCIWLGEQDDQSEVAFKFIREEITHLKDFDAISSDKDYSSKWQALMMLMQREWFSRRWVVQELSLANKAELWCGPDSMPWKEFAVAVELFVEVESATHRLSEVMRKDEKFQHVPGWFEHVSELGASLLVQATGKVFRVYGTPMDENKHNGGRTLEAMTDKQKAEREKKEKKAAKDLKHDLRTKSLKSIHTIDPLDRRSLLSLEFLVTTMFIFKASECRDSVYSMLAIARDAAPFAEPTGTTNDVFFRMSLFEGFLAEKPFLVDYARPYSDVCRDFMEFCIQRKSSQDPVQALDILCRPWALEPQRGRSIRVKADKSAAAAPKDPSSRLKEKRIRPWEKLLCKVLVIGDPKALTWIYDKQPTDAKVVDERSMEQYWKDINSKSEWKDQDFTWKVPRGWHKVQALCKDSRTQKEEKKSGVIRAEPNNDIPLPSWVPRAKNAPFEIYRQPGIEAKKTGRINADPLVGWPQDGHRNYSAAQTEAVKLDYLKFKKRPSMGHYSLYVVGFKVDQVTEVREASQGGSIPNSWLELGGWDPPYKEDPPAEFWRTIVADRGFENRNPPYYYARACRESVHKGGRESGRVNTTALIDNERNSIIAEFCRRVHAVIWGRSLFKTKGGNLGLAKDVKEGDWVCVLHGCTVPVILSPRNKAKGDTKREDREDRYESFKSCFERMENICVRKKRYEDQKQLQEKKEEEARQLKERQKEEEKARQLKEKQREEERQQQKEGQKEKENQQQDEKHKKKEEKDQHTAHEEGPKVGQEAQQHAQEESNRKTFYVFKGESYVHGCMDGEAVRNRFYGTEGECIFELR